MRELTIFRRTVGVNLTQVFEIKFTFASIQETLDRDHWCSIFVNDEMVVFTSALLLPWHAASAQVKIATAVKLICRFEAALKSRSNLCDFADVA